MLLSDESQRTTLAFPLYARSCDALELIYVYRSLRHKKAYDSYDGVNEIVEET